MLTPILIVLAVVAWVILVGAWVIRILNCVLGWAVQAFTEPRVELPVDRRRRLLKGWLIRALLVAIALVPIFTCNGCAVNTPPEDRHWKDARYNELVSGEVPGDPSWRRHAIIVEVPGHKGEVLYVVFGEEPPK